MYIYLCKYISNVKLYVRGTDYGMSDVQLYVQGTAYGVLDVESFVRGADYGVLDVTLYEHVIEESGGDQPFVPPEPVLKGLERSCLLVEVGGGQFEWRHVCVRLQAYVR